MGRAKTLSFVCAGIARATCPAEQGLDGALRAKLDLLREEDRPGMDWKELGFASRRSSDFRSLNLLSGFGDFIERIPYSSLTAERWDEIEGKGRPVIVLDVPGHEGWAAVERWSPKRLKEDWGNVSFKCASDAEDRPLQMPLDDFLRYAVANCDDSPLYLFDNLSVEREVKAPLRQDYDVPSFIRHDLFRFVPEDIRPPCA